MSYAFSSSSSFWWSSSSWSWSASIWSDADRFPNVMCRNPFVKDDAAYGCGQCLPCRINRRRVWVHRIMLEAMSWKETSFVSLSYSEEQLRFTSSVCNVATLVPEDLTKFLKRLRGVLAPAKLRYYAVGEYGREGERAECWNPHYHVAFFGLPTCERGDSSLSVFRPCECRYCVLVRTTWALGRVHLGSLTLKSAQYIAGYIVEKLRSEVRDDLDGRYPEFARMSLRPGIGVGAMSDVAEGLRMARLGDVEDAPAALQHGGRVLPLGRTLTRKLRNALGRSEDAPEVTLAKYREEMRPLWEDAKVAAQKNVENGLPPNLTHEFRRRLLDVDEQRVLQLKSRVKLFERGKR